MRIGIDFDNTIVRYDEVFHQVALEQGLIAPTLPVSKQAVRDHLRAVGLESRWTEMQGYVYGPRLLDALPFPGLLDRLARLVREVGDVFVVSHKTKHPYLGPPYDLHASALAWMDKQGFFDPARIGLPRENVFLELTKQAKMQRIAALGCTHFIDDLPELLAEPDFPDVVRILFDPNGDHADRTEFVRLSAWSCLDLSRRAA